MKHTGAMQHAAELGIAWCIVAMLVATALAQDVPGIEICTRESRMDRRTGCLQSNINYLKTAVATEVGKVRAEPNIVTFRICACGANIL